MTTHHDIPASPPAAPEVDVTGLYRAHVRPLYGFIYSKVGNRAAAEDLTSDVFVKALTHLDPTRAQHSCVAWLYRVARNAVADYWRAGQDVTLIALEDAQPPSLSHPAQETAQQEHTAAAARAAAILACLPDNYRTVLALRLLDGLSVAETAQRMGVSTGNVKVLQHRALKAAARQRDDDPAGR
jgi:RNA polymerase sigma factor (sigma-70 family)